MSRFYGYDMFFEHFGMFPFVLKYQNCTVLQLHLVNATCLNRKDNTIQSWKYLLTPTLPALHGNLLSYEKIRHVGIVVKTCTCWKQRWTPIYRNNGINMNKYISIHIKYSTRLKLIVLFSIKLKICRSMFVNIISLVSYHKNIIRI